MHATMRLLTKTHTHSLSVTYCILDVVVSVESKHRIQPVSLAPELPYGTLEDSGMWLP